MRGDEEVLRHLRYIKNSNGLDACEIDGHDWGILEPYFNEGLIDEKRGIVRLTGRGKALLVGSDDEPTEEPWESSTPRGVGRGPVVVAALLVIAAAAAAAHGAGGFATFLGIAAGVAAAVAWYRRRRA